MAGRARLLVDRGAVRGLREHGAIKDHASQHTDRYECCTHVMPPDEAD